MMRDMMNKLIPPKEAASMCGVSVKTLKRWESDGIISAIRLPGTSKQIGARRFSSDDIEALLKRK